MSKCYKLGIRTIHQTIKTLAKNDSSTIDSYRLPSQTSINEWEFRYDFIPKVAEPKVPPISEQAIKQDIAHERKKRVEQDMLNEEGSKSVKIEANHADVVHGGESVGQEPEFLHDRGSQPIKVQGRNSNASDGRLKQTREQYIQSSTNPELNKPQVNNLGHDRVVDHKQTEVKPSQVIDDLEHDNLHNRGQEIPKAGLPNQFVLTLGLVGLGAGSYWYFSSGSQNSQQDKK